VIEGEEEISEIVTANDLPISTILSTLKMEVIVSSEKSVLTRSPWHHFPEEVLHSHRRENF
jgi:hypothetical protein